MKTYPSIIKVILAVFYIASSTSVAGFIANPGTCSTSNATLTSIQFTDGLAPSGELLSQPYNATHCAGVYPGNDDGGLSSPDPNIGQYQDGILNGEDIMNGLEFITLSDLQALDPDGIANDPGWIHLGSLDTNGNVSYSSAGPTPSVNLTLDIGNLLTLEFGCLSGGFSDCNELSWELTTKLDIIPTVQELLGESTFDHLAFSVKAGSEQSGGGFAVYDFDFNEIFANENNPLLNFNTPYKLAGNIYTGDLDNKGFSHLNVWARDPVDTSDVPEPDSLFLLALVILLLVAKNKYRRIN